MPAGTRACLLKVHRFRLGLLKAQITEAQRGIPECRFLLSNPEAVHEGGTCQDEQHMQQTVALSKKALGPARGCDCNDLYAGAPSRLSTRFCSVSVCNHCLHC